MARHDKVVHAGTHQGDAATGDGSFSPAWRLPTVETDVEVARLALGVRGAPWVLEEALGRGGGSGGSFNVPIHGGSSSMVDDADPIIRKKEGDVNKVCHDLG
jgi:hypothetical protein